MSITPCKICPVPADCQRADNCAWDAADKIVTAAKCRRHPDRPVTPFDMGDKFCIECFTKAWNAGAHWADEHWADDPKPAYEMTTSGQIYQPESTRNNATAIYTRRRDENNLDRSSKE